MGANTFGAVGKGKTAAEAFSNAGGGAGEAYAGDISAKSSFVVLTPPPSVKDVYAWADGLIDACDRRIDSKWGPAGAVKVKEDVWYFFGWASS